MDSIEHGKNSYLKLKAENEVIQVQTLQTKMEKFDLQVMLADGSFADYEVQTQRDAKVYEVLQNGKYLASFSATEDGGWALEQNPANIDEDLRNRITQQLNGYRR